MATLLVMQARNRVTAAELAEELEISVATARRDLEALSGAGIPVYPQMGRGGGWQLIGGARTDLSGLSSDEARALFLLVGPAAAVDSEAKSALRKLVRALPETFRADATAAAGAVVLDPSTWGRELTATSPFLTALQNAVIERKKVNITYRGWDSDTAERVVDPWGLIEKGRVWYLIGGVGGSQRTFRLDRMVDVATTGDPAGRPENFDLETAWATVVTDVDRARFRASATLQTDAATVPYLRELFGPAGVTQTGGLGNRVQLTVSAPTEALVARKLAGWGDQVEVIGPASVRAEMVRLCEHVLSRYPL